MFDLGWCAFFGQLRMHAIQLTLGFSFEINNFEEAPRKLEVTVQFINILRKY